MRLVYPSLARAIGDLRNGTYVLILRLDAPCTLVVGKLGLCAMPRGWYAYVGSAQGPGGLAARLRRHVIGSERLHWHIDYLRQHAEPVGVWAVEGAAPLEHDWAQALLSMPEASVVVARFGASDCQCTTHLVHFPGLPGAAQFQARIARRMPHGAALRIFSTPEHVSD
jgi:Uri superfamily endonuclease